MRTEVPVFKRCCFFLPVRYGILTWGYVSLVINFLLLLELTIWLINALRYYPTVIFTLNYCVFFNGLSFLLKVVNFAFLCLLIIAAHRKNSRLLMIYYCGQLFTVAAIFVLVTGELVLDIIEFRQWFYSFSWNIYFWWDILILPLVWISYIGLQFYILAVVRSEILKLNRQHQVRFSNIAAETECEYYAVHESLQTNTQTLKI